MEPAHDSTVSFRRRLLGYDRREVDRALTSSTEALRRARTRCDELAAGATNVERIGAEVADMIRALAERAVELEDEAAATAKQAVEEARVEADGIRAEAAAVLADARRQADELLLDFGRRQAAASTRRQSAVAALQVAMDQIRRLTGSIEEIGPDVLGDEPDQSTDVIVLATSSAATANPSENPPQPAVAEEGLEDDEHSVAAAMERISRLTKSLS